MKLRLKSVKILFMTRCKTKQENFWEGKFGDEYNKRNLDEEVLSANLALFSRILKQTNSIDSVIEFGAGTGNNLYALKKLLPRIKMSAVEINKQAARSTKKQIPGVRIYRQSILDFCSPLLFDMVLFKTILIHVKPEELKKVYEMAYKMCRHYICLVEYYNPTPVEVKYRGRQGFLFKRDFAGEMLSKFKDLHLTDYGFAYHRDNNFIYDDFNWFLLEKK